MRPNRQEDLWNSKRRKPAPVFTARLMVNFPPETFARLQREAEVTQSTMAGVARSLIARALARTDQPRPAHYGDEDQHANAA